MTHTSTEQPEALMRLADNYAEACFDQGLNQRTTDDKPETEREKLENAIRHQHARIAELATQLSAIGADSLAATPAAGELATLQAGLQAAAPNAPLYDPREVAFSAQAAPQAVQEAAVPVAGQYRFKGEKDWHWCSLEHVAMAAATPSEWQGYEARYLYAHAAPAHPAGGVPAQAGAYAEARECEHCNHVGINDAANGIASCTACKWNGDSPKEDKCPDCEAEGTMTASCPKCHHEYRLIADATLAATQPAAQGLDAETQRHAAIGKAIERACMDLPDGTKISVSLEKDAGTVTLIDQYGNEHENFSTDYGFAGVLNEAIDSALAAQAKQGV